MGNKTEYLTLGLSGVIILMILLMPAFSLAQYSIKDIGGFESDLPSYWTKGNEPGGSTLTWATDEYRSLGRSLKISKDVTGDSAAWVSENMCDQWTPFHPKDEDLVLGAWVMTDNVNTNPASDDERWYMKWQFWGQGGNYIGSSMVPIDQSVATSGAFVVDTNGVGDVILPEDSYTTIVSFVGGPNATGTVWIDDIITAWGRGAKWSSIWNDHFICPTGWFYWLPTTGEWEVSNGYENTRLTDEEAHTGLYSLMFDLPFDRAPGDAFIGAKRVLLDQSTYDPGKNASTNDPWKTLSAQPGDMVRISVWIKAENLVPDSAAAYPESWSCGFTPIFFESAGNNDGFDDIIVLATDRFFKFPAVESFDWTEYYLDIEVPEGAGAMSVRLHPYSKMTGTVYFDDLSIKVIGNPTGVEDLSANQPFRFELSENYPNPFNPTTTISYTIPNADRVTLEIFNVLGQRVRTLIDEPQNAGHYQVVWDGKDFQGKSIGSGIYFYQLRSGKAVTVKKMVLLK